MARGRAQVWVRLGDQGEYEPYSNPQEAGEEVGRFTVDRSPRWIGKGVSLGGFTGDNYISVFWGDEDAQPVSRADLSVQERSQFISGMHESDDEAEERWGVRPRRITLPSGSREGFRRLAKSPRKASKPRSSRAGTVRKGR